MSDLRRWSEEGATPEEIALVEAAQRDRAPADARLRTLEALAVAAAVTTTAAASATAAATTAATTAGAMTPAGATGVAVTAATGGLSVATKVVAISMLGGIVAGGVVVSASHRPPGPGHSLVAPAAAEHTVVESAKAALPSPAVASSTGPVPVGPYARSALPASTEDRLSREVAALELAHRALADHNPESALRLLDRYRARFPAGTLASEETVLRVQALLATGERTRAQALADSYSAAHPDSPYSRRLEGLVHSGP